jgi:hypothetical protein
MNKDSDHKTQPEDDDVAGHLAEKPWAAGHKVAVA